MLPYYAICHPANHPPRSCSAVTPGQPTPSITAELGNTRYYNVRANPRVEVQDGPRRQDMIAREVSGEERAEWWKRAVAAYPPYAEYQERTTREIPVFVLEPVTS